MKIDLNCDLGEWKTPESRLNDQKIMPYITSCNIACGGHIGDDESMKSTIKLAADNGVAVGLHPSYPDKENFGRQILNISPKELLNSLKSQVEVFMDHASNLDVDVHHLKPHGALYNVAAKDEKIAKIIVQCLEDLQLKLPIYTLPNSALKRVAEQRGLHVSKKYLLTEPMKTPLNYEPELSPALYSVISYKYKSIFIEWLLMALLKRIQVRLNLLMLKRCVCIAIRKELFI